MSFISTTIVQTAKTASSATYKCTVSVKKTSWFGINPSTNYEAIVDHTGKAVKYIGWPKLSSWTNSMGYPAAALINESNITTSKWGTAKGLLLQNFTYSFTKTVNISRGNKRKGTLSIKAGCASSYKSGDFYSALKSFTLETSEIANAEWVGKAQVTVNRSNIVITRAWKNKENYYTCRVFDPRGPIIATNTNGNLNVTIPIKKEWYGTVQTFSIDIIGKDGSTNKSKEKINVTIPKQGVGLTVKHDGIHEVNPAYFKNVSNKEPKEVWIKINGKIKQTIK